MDLRRSESFLLQPKVAADSDREYFVAGMTKETYDECKRGIEQGELTRNYQSRRDTIRWKNKAIWST
ncbi:hypothetical protein WH47_09335 [Habropoda laboriosa]|uniref:Uncharacterized protein n=1 Tax=Habropoda laboriosa TaxID=597456 RepID=A0A0L7REK2_9HYME|nr:hypothetical protein WH47_09335 [Habropoda laboriosa]